MKKTIELHPLDKFIYVERESPFPFEKKKMGNDFITKLKNVQRALGVVKGTIEEIDEKDSCGILNIEGQKIPFANARGEKLANKLLSAKGKEHLFCIWPSLDEMPKKTGLKLSRFTPLKISSIRSNETPKPGYFEIIGKLEKIWKNEFLVSIWSKPLKKSFYIPIAGEYPFADELGNYLWVVGKFDPKSAVIRFEEADSIAFVPKEEIIAHKKNGVPIAISKIIVEKHKKKTLTEFELNKRIKKYNEDKVIKPIVLKQIDGGKYCVVNGNKRIELALALGLSHISATIVKPYQKQKLTKR